MSEAQEDYQLYRARMSEKATEFEDFVFDLLRKHGLTVNRYVSRKWQYGVGECSGGIEVKFDDRMRETDNVYIEVAEKAQPNESRAYSPSGIYRNDNSWLYVIGDYYTVYVFAKKTLQHLHKSGRYEQKSKPTSLAFVLPKAKAELHAARVFRGEG
ncbi:MAG: hypothetical protein WKF67_05750 [Rubrobacteraceae bacterium]